MQVKTYRHALQEWRAFEGGIAPNVDSAFNRVALIEYERYIRNQINAGVLR